jgi:hypothetical protein
MPALVRQGPFSYDSNGYSATRTYNLVKAAFVADKGDILEVIINGVKIVGEGANVVGDEFTVNSLTNPTSITVVTTFTTTDPDTSVALVFTTGTIIVKRLSNRSTTVVDFAPGSVIREVDLDSSTNQTLHVAQEAIDIALNAMVLQANDKFDGRSKVVENVADGVADNDAVNIGQLETHNDIITGYRDTTNDYKLEAKDWAQRTTSQVKVYTDGVVSGSFIEDSAKNWASGITSAAPTAGSAKEWAIGGEGTMATTPNGSEFSAKEYAQGATATGGTSKEWATNAGSAEVHGGAGYSSKAYSQDTANDIGSSKDWAIKTSAIVDSADYSSKEWAAGQLAANTAGSAKQWSIGGGAFVEGTVVTGSSYSSKKYATDSATSATASAASETAAANSAASVSQVYDSFNDVYLGSMRTDKTVADAVTLTGASWAKDSSSIAFSGISSGTVTIGQELTTTSGSPNVYPVGANIIGSQTTTPLVISNPFTVAGTGATLVFVGSGVNGAFNASTGGPSLNNDGDALANGNLYFNSQANEMRIFQGAEWIAATAVGQTSLLEYKYVTNANQVDSGHAAYKTYVGVDAGGSATLSYTQDNIIVFMNGVQLKGTTDYVATNGSSVVLVATPVLNDEIAIVAFKSFTTADMVSASNGGTFSSAVTFSAVPVFSAGVGGITGTTIDATTDFTIGGLVITDNTITDDGTLTITATTGITLGQDTALSAGKDLETSTTGKVKQKGAFMQSSTHQALTLGG